MKNIVLVVFLVLLGCEPGQEFIKCAEACRISGLKMVECNTNSFGNKEGLTVSPVTSCKCGEPLRKD